MDKELEARVRKMIASSRRKIRLHLKPMVFQAVYDSPEMQSVRWGQLKIDFGIYTDPTTMIAEAVADSMIIKYTPDINYLALFTIEIQPRNHENLYNLRGAVNISEKGHIVPWLYWLLEEGDWPLISNFGVMYKAGFGVSGGGFMAPNYNTPFRVAPEYAGVFEDNFISRALNRNYKKMQDKAWQIYMS